MPLALVIHDLAPGSNAAQAMFHAIYQIAPEHWPVTETAVLLETGVSPGYLRDYLVRTLVLQGEQPGVLLVTPLGENAAWSGLPAEGEAWLRDNMAP